MVRREGGDAKGLGRVLPNAGQKYTGDSTILKNSYKVSVRLLVG